MSRERTFSLQTTLPRLPVPSLEETCSTYLKSIIPLQTSKEHEQTKAKVQDFLNSPLSKSLQQRLIDIERNSPFNWLEDNFWLRKAYLEWREPLMINSNWYILGQADPNHPRQLLANRGVQPSGYFSKFQIKRAAHMIRRGLEYKEMIDREEIPVDMMKGNQPLCMWQYSKIFCVTRIPQYYCDTLLQANPKEIRHIIILVRDQVYQLDVYRQLKKDIWVMLTADEIEAALLALVEDIEKAKDQLSPAVPLLTSWHRDKWTVARNHLLTLNNRDSLNVIESALFAVALDDHSNGTDGNKWTHTIFCGHQGLGNGHNRWFDKSITLVVENNGMCAFAGEHSPVDALIVSYILDYMLIEPVPGIHTHEFIFPSISSTTTTGFKRLVFQTDSIIASYIKEAQKDADQVAAQSDPNVLIFKDYGTDWVKKVARVSPDAFYQMVLQLTYYRIHQRMVATYETASTRQYQHGRTETIRTCSIDTKAFVQAFDSNTVTAQEKYRLFKKATESHGRYTQMASNGYGCDRHFLGLRTLNENHQMMNEQGELVQTPLHPMFTDPIFSESQTWRLSTSGLHAGIRLMGTGFGTPCSDGYGINYMAAPTLVKFGIETKKVKETVSTKDVMRVITTVLKDLHVLCEHIVQNKL